MTMSTLKRFVTVAAATASIATSSVVLADSAHAAARDGKCDKGEFCLYYNSNINGAISDFTKSVSDYGAKQPSCFEFKGHAKGHGQCVKNHAASAWNRTGKVVRVYYNSGYLGKTQDFKPNERANLKGKLKNGTASHEINPSKLVKLSYALYKASGGRISCGFDGYTTTKGRHEGIDIARGIGSDVHALVAGTVTYVHQGYKGRPGLSTIAVYNKAANKTVIYLHSAPRGFVSVGDTIKRGQVIADESWHGVSSASAAHTHVEMRPGRQTHASISVGDKHLDNPNPAAFWRSQGYSEK